MPSPLDFTNPNAGFQSLPPEVLQYMQQQGNPMASGLMAPPPPQGGAPVAAPRPPMPTAPATVPQQPVTQPPMGAGQNALLDAGSAMLMNSGTSLGRAVGAGLATGKASFEATKNAEEDRKAQQAQAELYYKMLDDPQLGLTPQQLALAKAMPVAQGMAELAKIGFTPKKFAQNDKNQVLQTEGNGAGTVVRQGDRPLVKGGPGDVFFETDDQGQIKRNPDGTAIISAKIPEKAPEVLQDKDWNTAAQMVTAKHPGGPTTSAAQMTDQELKQVWDLANTYRRSGATQGDKAQNAFDAAIPGELAKFREESKGSATGLASVNESLASLNKGIFTGPFAGIQLLATRVFNPSDPRVVQTQQYIANAVQGMAPLIRLAKISRLTEYELKIYRQAAGGDNSFGEQGLRALLSAQKKLYTANIDENNSNVDALTTGHEQFRPAYHVNLPDDPTSTVAPAGARKEGETWRDATGQWHKIINGVDNTGH